MSVDEDTEDAQWHQQEQEAKRFREECDEFERQSREFMKWLRGAASEQE